MYKFPLKDRVPTSISSKYSYHIKTDGPSDLITNWFQQILKQYSITTSTSIDNLNIVKSYILSYTNNCLLPKVSKNYGLSDDYIYKITNIQFEYYDKLNQTFDRFQKDDSNLTCRILVQTYSNECSLVFDDDITHSLQEGDLIIYSNKNNYMIKCSENISPIFLVINIDLYSKYTSEFYSSWPNEVNNRYKDCI